jgi:hypothetical protein
MDTIVLILGPILFLVGAWAATHPNGGYRAVAGVGSSLGPGTRRFFGIVFVAIGLVLMFAPITW